MINKTAVNFLKHLFHDKEIKTLSESIWKK